MKAGMAPEPLHARLRAAAFKYQNDDVLSRLLLEAAGVLSPANPRRDTLAVIADHAAREAEGAAIANPTGDVISPRTFRAPEPPPALEAPFGGRVPTAEDMARFAPTLAACRHCGEEYILGSTHCPECSGRVA